MFLATAASPAGVFNELRWSGRTTLGLEHTCPLHEDAGFQAVFTLHASLKTQMKLAVTLRCGSNFAG